MILAGAIFECQFFCYRPLFPAQVWLMSTLPAGTRWRRLPIFKNSKTSSKA
jgi:hypothetical protein